MQIRKGLFTVTMLYTYAGWDKEVYRLVSVLPSGFAWLQEKQEVVYALGYLVAAR